MFSKRTGAVWKLMIFSAALLTVCLILFLQPNQIKVFQFSKTGTKVTQTFFISRKTNIIMSAPSGAVVYYTTDGSTPDSGASVYASPIVLQPSSGDFPNCLLIKAVAVFADGSHSEIATHTFLAHTDIANQYQALILSVSGDPDTLTNGPDGILYGDNVYLRGAESERQVYIEAISPGGMPVFRQNAGARPYGGLSRNSAIKSLKIFARKEYDDAYGKFNIDLFGTLGADGQIIDKYDKLVIRNCANDLYHGYIRDELCQRLAAQAGHTDYQEVLPAVVYLNGTYYGFFWLHENYCDDLLKDKYGEGPGTFQILEGSEIQKTVDETDPLQMSAANTFNALYNELAYSDLTLKENYAKLCQFIDVENYLDNYAFNIYINNTDWPQNNYKCYRYYAAANESYQSGHLDGRWRFLYHDMDYTFSIYGQERSSAANNNIAGLLSKDSNRYSPLFTALMQRDDCRAYFLNEIIQLRDGVLSADNVITTLNEMDAQRSTEIYRFCASIADDNSIPVTQSAAYQRYLHSTEAIRQFASDRWSHLETHMIEALNLPEDFFE